ncbi:MAG TPA: hypothetical protein VLD67_05385 [Vicinamibacterales bacterium]|nr:hypothetical protein [Vicinamibacterales bacterium]
MVYPSAFETLEELGAGAAAPGRQAAVDVRYDTYLRLDPEARRRRCTI